VPPGTVIIFPDKNLEAVMKLALAKFQGEEIMAAGVRWAHRAQ
jgi:hypothetical protein